jgi:alkylation response protein AidB-like acyl-CoA dehydrogenase
VDFELNTEQALLRDSIRAFCREEIPVRPYARDVVDGNREVGEAVHAQLVELGLGGLLVPTSLGGAGAGFAEMGIVLEELGRVVAPVSFTASAALAAGVLKAVNADAADVLSGIAAGTVRAAVAHLDLGSRSAWDDPVALFMEDRVTARKTHVEDADVADVLVVSCMVDGLQGWALVERESVVLTPTDGIDPTRSLFEVEIPAAEARILTAVSKEGALAATDWLVLARLSDAVGAAAGALEIALAYAKEREQFGKPIGSFQAVQHLLVDMLCDLELSRAGLYYALWALDEAAPRERHLAVAVSAAFAVEALPRVGANAIQVFGGIGYTWEHDAHLFYKRLLSMQSLCGTPQAHLEELARAYDELRHAEELAEVAS